MNNSERKDMVASDIIEYNSLLYAEEILKTQHPNLIDGLKLVYRRIIQTIGTCKDQKKCLSWISETIGNYHTSGDQSVHSTITRLMQDFQFAVPLVEAVGNAGTYNGDEPAAPRYLEGLSSPFSRDVFFTNVNMRTLEKQESEVSNLPEIQYFIPRLPTTLLLSVMSVGYGYGSRTFALGLEEVAILVKNYITERGPLIAGQTIDKHLFVKNNAKYMIPQLPVDNAIRNPKAIIKQRINRQPVMMIADGAMELYPNMIVIKALPYGTPLAPLGELFEKQYKNKSSWFSKAAVTYKDESDKKVGTKIVVYFKRNIDIFDILEDFKKLIKFSGILRDDPNYIDVDLNLYIGVQPVDLLEYWYEKRYSSMFAGFRFDQAVKIAEYNKFRTLLIIKDHLDETLDIIKNSEDAKDAIHKLSNRFSISLAQGKVLVDMPVSQIIKDARLDIPKQLEIIENEIAAINDKILHTQDIIIEEATLLARRYAPQVKYRSIVKQYKGCVSIEPKGLIQFETDNELIAICDRFKNRIESIVFYQPGNKYIINSQIDYDSTIEYPKEMVGTSMCAIRTSCKPTYTVINNTVEGKTVFVTGIKPVNNGCSFEYISKEFLVITSSGNLQKCNISDVPVRKQISLGTNQEMLYVSPVVSNDCIIFYISSGHPTEIRVMRFKDMKGKLKLIKSGKTQILAIVSVADKEKDVMLNIPNFFMARSTIKHVLVKNVDILFNKYDKLYTITYTVKTSKNVKISKYPGLKSAIVIS